MQTPVTVVCTDNCLQSMSMFLKKMRHQSVISLSQEETLPTLLVILRAAESFDTDCDTFSLLFKVSLLGVRKISLSS
jgi:hypothetical protein